MKPAPRSDDYVIKESLKELYLKYHMPEAAHERSRNARAHFKQAIDKIQEEVYEDYSYVNFGDEEHSMLDDWEAQSLRLMVQKFRKYAKSKFSDAIAAVIKDCREQLKAKLEQIEECMNPEKKSRRRLLQGNK